MGHDSVPLAWVPSVKLLDFHETVVMPTSPEHRHLYSGQWISPSNPISPYHFPAILIYLLIYSNVTHLVFQAICSFCSNYQFILPWMVEVQIYVHLVSLNVPTLINIFNLMFSLTFLAFQPVKRLLPLG